MRAIVVVDHGSRRDEANEVVVQVAAQLREAHPGVHVEPAHMELAAPTIEDAIAACVAAGARSIVVVPYFLGPGRHAAEDVPRLVREAVTSHPGVDAEVAPPFGPDPLITQLVARRAGLD